MHASDTQELFYYIIPEPDGTKESGESLRQVFSTRMEDDTASIQSLPELWNNFLFREEATDALELECGGGVVSPLHGGSGGRTE